MSKHLKEGKRGNVDRFRIIDKIGILFQHPLARSERSDTLISREVQGFLRKLEPWKTIPGHTYSTWRCGAWAPHTLTSKEVV